MILVRWWKWLWGQQVPKSVPPEFKPYSKTLPVQDSSVAPWINPSQTRTEVITSPLVPKPEQLTEHSNEPLPHPPPELLAQTEPDPPSDFPTDLKTEPLTGAQAEPEVEPETEPPTELPTEHPMQTSSTEPATTMTTPTPALPMPEPPKPDPRSTGPYQNGLEHLQDELERIDGLVRAQTLRWQQSMGTYKPDDKWGMPLINEAEINAYLRSTFHLPNGITNEDSDIAHLNHVQELTQTITERLRTTPAGTARLRHLQNLFHLSDLACDVLLICLLAELDARYRRLYGYLMDDASRSLPDIELICQILQPLYPHEQVRAELHATMPLSQHQLITLLEVRNDESLSMRAVRLEERIVAHLTGSDISDGRLNNLLTTAQACAWTDLITEPNTAAQLQTVATWWQNQQQLVLFLHGPSDQNGLKAARALCTANGVPLLTADVRAALQHPLGWQRVINLAYREARLQNAALIWMGCEILLQDPQQATNWQHLIETTETFPGLTCLISQKNWEPTGQLRQTPYLNLAFPRPTYPLRVRLWTHHLNLPASHLKPGLEIPKLADALANSFQFSEHQIEDAIATAQAEARRRNPNQATIGLEDLFEGCRKQSSHNLIQFAKRIGTPPRAIDDLNQPARSFDDLILPELSKRQLTELRNRIHHRNRVYSDLGFEERLSLGKGLVVLFTGTSGTGKTMAAELLARDQQVDLYKVDLAGVVSKYVGETEKNLNRVFSEAEDANAILFFDEADSLFGKRGEVKEAQDRWANMEVNYLLQRIEEYAGVVILASNLKQNIDDAFKRRIQVIVDFPFPDEQARFVIYQNMFPPTLERPSDDDLHRLAKSFKLSGGSIKNIVLDAAFRAISDQQDQKLERPVLTIRHMVLATGREYQKLGKPITRSEFIEEFYGWLEGNIF